MTDDRDDTTPAKGYPRSEADQGPFPEDEPDPGFSRLRDSDPITVGELDLTAVRSEVDRRLAVERPRTAAMRWMRVAAAVAGVAVIGATGFFIGSRTTNGTVASSQVAITPATGAARDSTVAGQAPGGVGAAAPAIGLGGAPRPGAAGRPEAAAGPPLPAGRYGAPAGGTVATDSLYGGYGWWGRTVFSGEGLSKDGGTGEVWAYDPSKVVSAESAEKVAAALGVTGSATEQWGAWVVGGTDGSRPSVSLAGDGVGSVGYSNPGVSNVPICEGAAIASDLTTMPQPDCGANQGPPAITGAEAITKMRDVLTKLGQNLDAFEFESPDEQKSGSYAYASAYSVLNGQRTGQAWSFSFVGSDISSIYGQLAPVVSMGQYKVVSPTEALARLNDPRFGSTGAVYPTDYAWPTNAKMNTDQSTAVTVPPLPSAGGAIAWPVNQVKITGAKLGVAAQWQTNGSVLLVPAYSLTTADGVSWSVIAVADSQLDFKS